MTEAAPPSQARSWRPLQLMLAAVLVAVTLQVVLGEEVSFIANYPVTPVANGSIGSLLSAMWSAAGPSLIIHAFLGVLVVLIGIWTTVVALRYHKRSVTATAVLALVSLVIAILGGFIWASSDFANELGTTLMQNAALVAYVFLLLALYFTGWPSTLRSKT
jgi:uncharacterized protein YybS (DUF2232 family)